MLIGGFQSLSLSDYPGHCASIIFTRGCNFRCGYCHNHYIIDTYHQNDSYDNQKIINHLKKRKGLIDAVVITGGEPTLQNDLADFMISVKNIGLKVKLDTNGSRPQVLKNLLDGELPDYIAMDVKSPPEKYSLLCGKDGYWPKIAQSIDIINHSGIPAEYRTTFVTDLLNEFDLEKIRELLPENCTYKVQDYIAENTLENYNAQQRSKT